MWRLSGASYLQHTVFANYLQKDYEFYSNSYFGALGAQATRLRETLNEYNHVFTLNGMRQLVVVGGGIVVIGFQSMLLAVVTLGLMVAVLSYTLWSGAWRLKYRRALSEAGSELAGMIGDALSHGSTVKSFAAEAYEEKRMEKVIRPWAHKQWLSWLTSIPADVGRAILAAAAICILLMMTARLYQQEAISIAMVALIQLYVIKMIAATQDIAELIKSYETVMGAAYQPVRTMLEQPTIIDPAKPKLLPRRRSLQIAFDQVTYQYPGTAQNDRAVRDFSLTIEKGQKIGLVGYSGSGKTTLTKLLLRFMDTGSGAVRINDVDIRDLRQRTLRHLIAYVPQEPLLFHRTIYENIAYGKPAASQKSIQAAAKMAYVDEFASKLPNAYQTFVGERGVKLSGGQRQRVAIARAILKDAPILVLDEATSALDSRSERLIQKALWRLMKDRTTLVIAHRLSTIQRMDRIIVMHHGRIVQTGTHQQLLRDEEGIYAKLWSHQSGGYIGVPQDTAEPSQPETVSRS